MASCKRSSSTSNDAFDGDEDEELGDDEQSKAEFAAFQEWLTKNEMDRQPIPKPSDPPDVKSVVGHPADISQHGIQDCLLCLVFKGSLGHHFVIPHHSPCLPAFPFCLGSHLAIKKRQLIELIAKKKAELEAKSKAAQEHAAAPLFLVSCSQAGVGTWGCDVLLLG